MGVRMIAGFYDGLAEWYHLIFEDWDRAMSRQAGVLVPLLGAGGRSLKILDCACGIGTQALGFAAAGHRVVGSDLSAGAIARARREASARGLGIEFHVADMTTLEGILEGEFDVVAALDNALPHLDAEGLRRATAAVGSKLKSGGLFLASIRDYDRLIKDRPTSQEPAFYGRSGERRIVHQVWDWIDRERYVVHLYLSVERGGEWETWHFVSEYRCLLREELSEALRGAGFSDVRWMGAEESGFYQPIVSARRG